MKTSESIKEIAVALVAAQKDMEPLVKDSTNPFFKSKYADLHQVVSACAPALQSSGICFVQSAEHTESGLDILTRLIHTSGEWIETVCSIPVAKNDAQAYGSSVTYGRRYGLQAAVGLAPQDDDGEVAMRRNSPKPKPQPKAPAVETGGTPVEPTLEEAKKTLCTRGASRGKPLGELSREILEKIKDAYATAWEDQVCKVAAKVLFENKPF